MKLTGTDRQADRQTGRHPLCFGRLRLQKVLDKHIHVFRHNKQKKLGVGGGPSEPTHSLVGLKNELELEVTIHFYLTSLFCKIFDYAISKCSFPQAKTDSKTSPVSIMFICNLRYCIILTKWMIPMALFFRVKSMENILLFT